MPKLDVAEQIEVTEKARKKVALATADLANRNLLYQLRRGYYDGTIVPDVERGHDLIVTEFARTITQKMAGYFMGNGFTIRMKPNDVSDDAQTVAAAIANEIADDRYNKNEGWQELMLDLAEQSSRDGDSFIAKRIEDGVPINYLVNDPGKVGIIFRDDSFKDIDLWTHTKGLNVDYIKDKYGIEVSPVAQKIETYQSGAVNTHKNPYGTVDPNYRRITQLLADTSPNMAEYTQINDTLNTCRIQMFNNTAYFKDEEPNILYHFKANSDPSRPWGYSDFESSAQLITALEEKLSEESDVVSQGSHQKIITDQNVTDIQKKWRPNRTQAFQIPRTPDGRGYMEILKTNDNVSSNQAFVNMLLNMIRTNSGLQELGQDQISANVSGRAIQFMFQGVQINIKKKRIRLNSLLRRLVIDDFKVLCERDTKLREALFDDDGEFKLRIDFKYPPVLEQEEQVRISNIQIMRQGEDPLISNYTARLLLSEYVDDPVAEEKQVRKERAALLKQQMEMQQAAQAAEQAAQAKQQQAIAPPEMEPQGEATPGVVSSPGEAGSAQQSVSPGGFQAQQLQQESGLNR